MPWNSGKRNVERTCPQLAEAAVAREGKERIYIAKAGSPESLRLPACFFLDFSNRLLISRRTIRGSRLWPGYTCSRSNPRQMRKERCYFERHLVACRSDRYRLALREINFVIPRIQFHAATQRQGCNLVQFVRVKCRR